VKLIYIAGPYRAKTIHGTKLNIRAAELRAEDAVRAGHYPIVPHLCTAFMDGLASDQHFLDGTLEAMRRCDEVWLCEGWRDSHGSKLEVATALTLGIPVKDLDGSRVRLLTVHAERRRKRLENA
jgi:hypothetical protein